MGQSRLYFIPLIFFGLVVKVSATECQITSPLPLPIAGSFTASASTATANVISTYTVVTTTYPISVSASLALPAITTVTVNGVAQPVTSTYTTVVSTGIPVTGTFWQGSQPVTSTSIYLVNPATITFNGVGQPVTSTSTYLINLATVTFNGIAQPTTSTSTYVVNLTTITHNGIGQPVTSTSTYVVNLTTVSFNGVAQPVTSTSTTVLQSTVGVVQMPITKGTQGTTGVTTQDLKDSGRSYVVFVATGVAGLTSEGLITFSQNKQGVQTDNVTSYTITNNKTLRIQGLYCSVRGAALPISWTRVVLRHNTNAVVVSTSPKVLGFEVGLSTGASNAVGYADAPIPDGIEFFGNGTQQIGVTHLDSATTNIDSCSMIGYEY